MSFIVMRPPKDMHRVPRSYVSMTINQPGLSLPPATTVDVCFHPDELPPDVKLLFAEAEKASVEFGISWYTNLVNAVYAGDDGVRFFILRRADEPIAVLPVRVVKNGSSARVESLSNYYSAIYAPVLAPNIQAIDLVPLISAIRNAHTSVSSIRFAPMDPESEGYQLLFKALKLVAMKPFEFFCFGNWFLTVDTNWSHYWGGRNGSLRNTIKRTGKRFFANGGTLEVVSGCGELERGLNAYEKVYAASWKGAEPFVDFIPGLVRTCAANGWLRLGVAWLKDEPIAAQIWIVADGKASIFKLAYHEAYKAYAPGTLLTAMLMQQAIEKDLVTEVDYLIGDDFYKKSWMSGRRERWGLIAYNLKSIAGIVGLCLEMAGRSFKALKIGLDSRQSTQARWWQPCAPSRTSERHHTQQYPINAQQNFDHEYPMEKSTRVNP